MTSVHTNTTAIANIQTSLLSMCIRILFVSVFPSCLGARLKQPRYDAGIARLSVPNV